MNQSLNTDKSKTNGLRSIKSVNDGTNHWWWQRFTAIILIPLSIWFISIVIKLFSCDKNVILTMFKSLLNIILLSVFITITLYHGTLGIQVIIEDYVHCKYKKFIMLQLTKSISILTVIAGVSAIFSYHFTDIIN